MTRADKNRCRICLKTTEKQFGTGLCRECYNRKDEFETPIGKLLRKRGGVAELADAPDLGSGECNAHGGSSPSAPTIDFDSGYRARSAACGRTAGTDIASSGGSSPTPGVSPIVVNVLVERLEDLASPFENRVWANVCSVPITHFDVIKALRTDRLAYHPPSSDGPDAELARKYTRKWHAERIAWFVVNGWTDPISVDVGCPELAPLSPGHWYVPDGNHRLGAAIFSGHKHIAATIDGSFEESFRLLGVRPDGK